MSTYLSKTIKVALALGVICFLVFTVGAPALVGSLGAAAIYVISSLIKDEVPLLRRVGAVYLAFAASTYIVPAAVGLQDNSGFAATILWNRLLNPYLLVWLSSHTRSDLSSLPDSSHYFMPDGVNTRFSYTVVVVSLIGITAALSMTRSSRIGLAIWIVLLSGSLLVFGCYLYVGILSWGLGAIGAQIFWEASYIVAFILATWKVKWGQPAVG